MNKMVIGAVALLFSYPCFSQTGTSSNTSAKKPNFLWLVTEDNSKDYLKHFSDTGVETPAISKLAEQGITFRSAYSNAPACSVARTTLQTGMYAPRLGGHHHRTNNKLPLPIQTRLLHEYLKEEGYYVINSAKTDYNLAVNGRRTWDQSKGKASWKMRTDPSQPFFQMKNFATTHEVKLHFGRGFFNKNKTQFDLNSAQLPPYFPNTELFQFTYLYYQSLIQDVDSLIGSVIEDLTDDGLLEDTFIFYFSDHGGVLPRSKGFLLESGLHIPLIVRIPKNFAHLVDNQTIDEVTGTVEFVDFAPTILNLAGVDIPSHFDGDAFLGPNVDMDEVQTRDESFSFANRMGEKIDVSRSIKKGKYQYIRHYQPYIPDGHHSSYRFRMLALQEWRSLFREGSLNEVQSQFFRSKPTEQLFDIEEDPHQVTNLASDPAHQSTLLDLRDQLTQKVQSIGDLGFFPESYLAEQNIFDPLIFSQDNEALISNLVDIANLQLEPFEDSKESIISALETNDSLVHFWALSVLLAYSDIDSEEIMEQVNKFTDSSHPSYVRVKALEVAGYYQWFDPQSQLAEIVNEETTHPSAISEALNAIIYLRDVQGYPSLIDELNPQVEDKNVRSSLSYLSKTSLN